MKTKYSGFTLAEVLITLGIIGIVAAMTLPSVINNSRNKQPEQTVGSRSEKSLFCNRPGT